MSKAIEENKQKVTIKRIVWKFKLFWKFIWTDKNNEKNEMNLPSPLSTPVTVFLITEKLLSI